MFPLSAETQSVVGQNCQTTSSPPDFHHFFDSSDSPDSRSQGRPDLHLYSPIYCSHRLPIGKCTIVLSNLRRHLQNIPAQGHRTDCLQPLGSNPWKHEARSTLTSFAFYPLPTPQLARAGCRQPSIFLTPALPGSSLFSLPP